MSRSVSLAPPTPSPPPATLQIIGFLKPAAGGAKVVKEYDGKRELPDFLDFVAKNGGGAAAEGSEDDDDLEL